MFTVQIVKKVLLGDFLSGLAHWPEAAYTRPMLFTSKVIYKFVRRFVLALMIATQVLTGCATTSGPNLSASPPYTLIADSTPGGDSIPQVSLGDNKGAVGAVGGALAGGAAGAVTFLPACANPIGLPLCAIGAVMTGLLALVGGLVGANAQ